MLLKRLIVTALNLKCKNALNDLQFVVLDLTVYCNLFFYVGSEVLPFQTLAL